MLKNYVVLYVEDEQITRSNTVEILQLMFNHLHVATNGQEGYKLYKELKPDIIIADIEMDYMNGLELASKIRDENKTSQIIITTAYTDSSYLLKALELNLVKYLTKPVLYEDLKKALEIANNNLQAISKSRILISESTVFDFKTRQLVQDGKKVVLTYQELIFLELLLKNANIFVSYETIESIVWDFEEYSMTIQALRTLVRTLRKKLPENTIENASKLGYKINCLN